MTLIIELSIYNSVLLFEAVIHAQWFSIFARLVKALQGCDLRSNVPYCCSACGIHSGLQYTPELTFVVSHSAKFIQRRLSVAQALHHTMTTQVKPASTPQAGINDFWSKFATKKPSKVTSIFPRLLYASILPEHPDPRGIASARNAADSYEAAAKECREKVEKIVRECHRTNEKFTDGDFDTESDFDGRRNCLNGLEYQDEEDGGKRSRSSSPSGRRRDDIRGTMRKKGVEMREEYRPCSVHRLEWIFKEPRFTIDGFSSSDIHQGSNGAFCMIPDFLQHCILITVQVTAGGSLLLQP